MRRSTLTTVLACLLLAAGGGAPPSASGQQYDSAAPELRPDEPDTVRTNLWLVEALMTDIVAEVATMLPPPPGAVFLEPTGDGEADELLTTVAVRDLSERGYDVYREEPDLSALLDTEETAALSTEEGAEDVALDPADLLDEEERGPLPPAAGARDAVEETEVDRSAEDGSGEGALPPDATQTSLATRAAAAAARTDPSREGPSGLGTVPAGGLLMNYRVMEVDLDYPETGRRLGLWRQWVARDIALTVSVSLEDRASGRLLVSDRFTRRYSDRVPDGDFDAVNSDIYPFTSAEPQRSGWQGRIEEIVVLGALAALVAVYLANTQ